MAAVRFTFLEILYAILVVAGGLTALAADKLEMESMKDAGLLVVFFGFIRTASALKAVAFQLFESLVN